MSASADGVGGLANGSRLTSPPKPAQSDTRFFLGQLGCFSWKSCEMLSCSRNGFLPGKGDGIAVREGRGPGTHVTAARGGSVVPVRVKPEFGRSVHGLELKAQPRDVESERLAERPGAGSRKVDSGRVSRISEPAPGHQRVHQHQ